MEIFVENDGKSFRFLGRKDRILKRWGQKINLALIEEAARKNACVSNCCCISDDQKGLVLFYQLLDNFKKGDDSELRCWLKTDGQLPNSASIPDITVQLHEMPLNSNGKIDRSHLKNLLREIDPTDRNEIPGSELHFRSLWLSCTLGSSTLDRAKQNESSRQGSSGFVSSGGTSISALNLISKLLDLHLKVPSALLTKMLSDCTFDECYNLFRGTKFGESSSESTVNRKQNVSSDISEPEMKRQKIAYPIFQESAESEVISVKCRGNVVRYSPIYNEKNEPNSSEKISLNVEWKYFLKKCVDASPSVIALKNGTTTVAVGSHSGDLVNLDLESGLPKFSCHLPDRIESSLTVSPCGRYGIVGCYDGYLRCIEMQTGKIVLSFASSGMIKSTAVLDNQGSIIFGSYDQHLYCLSDKFQLWSYKVDGNVFSSMTSSSYNNQTLILFGCHDSNVYCLSTCAPTNPPCLFWKACLSAPVFATPFVDLKKGLVVAANTTGTIYILKLYDGRLLTSLELPGPKNDLRDVRGVKRVMKSLQKSSKNDLRNVRGVKRVMTSPQKS
ncbi:hypothetical protein LSTR_LSTR017614 [Laodelphax striatellus]|uniref:Pyrrolo-quinoline quinone repeat domain-containing protein n=1 Tax=Laodelphax striatellus TaxID=195883 RepID=A0A482WI57_LAOST|nr:hypothetical protein LSTR_LSTR017614 [Laodelphax striatellus]